jgi:hypothetical protein
MFVPENPVYNLDISWAVKLTENGGQQTKSAKTILFSKTLYRIQRVESHKYKI